ncbi:glycoside hydrolase family 19 protein [Pantoea eucrina]|uniref:glycoside hydrolase family 19 protein n=1 Tax=Pantoea eucrina TaxID=472693 RepID=UPI000A221502|nr:glycoside hydrolase family 19 protein [Pantoea eucrina]ORM78335.1 hypothetical protein HA43_08300 [Pantoea eucrina]
MITLDQFRRATGISQALADMWFPHVAAAMREFGIDTPKRQAHFLAQVGHESAGFTKTEEGLNYSESALNAMFGKRITPSQARAYGRNNAHPADQCMIASIIYANRNGNGSIESGDGYRYRGRGLIQITGKKNYSALNAQLSADLIASPDLLSGRALAARSAAAWWKNHGLNELADAGNVDRITRVINGGLNGIDDRRQRTARALEVLCRT